MEIPGRSRDRGRPETAPESGRHGQDGSIDAIQAVRGADARTRALAGGEPGTPNRTEQNSVPISPPAPQGRQEVARRRKPRGMKDFDPSRAPSGAAGIPPRAESIPGGSLLRAAPVSGRRRPGILVRPHPGIRRPQPGGDIRSSPVRKRRDAAPLSPPLLEAPARRGLERTGAQSDPRDRGRDRGPESEDRERAVGGRGDPGPPPSRASEEPEEIARAAVPRLERPGALGALAGLPPVRRGLPAGRGEAPGGRSQCGVSARELPSGIARLSEGDFFRVLRADSR